MRAKSFMKLLALLTWSSSTRSLHQSIVLRRLILVFLSASELISSTGGASLPSRLVLLVDGVSYRDVKALQEGTGSDSAGNKRERAFQDGYFPASRLISTFPSISDTSWPEILGIDPPPGYQRTYFNSATGSEESINGVTKLAGYEQKMTWQMEGNFRRIMSYSSPARSFKYELNEMIKHFLQSSGAQPNFYAIIQSIDTGQHSWGDAQSMLFTLDKKLQELRATYRHREGRELEILILSDHGNNHAGAGRRIAIKSFLKKHGYRLANSLSDPKDVVLPTAGIESWAEIHNSPAETSNLVQLLSQLKGVDLVTARHPDQANCFIVRNSKGEQAEIEWDAKKNSFKYQMQTGDPLAYGTVVEALASNGSLDPNGFATADDWKTETLTHRYPLALERIVRAHTKVALNPASILLSLENGYIHSKWLIRRALDFARSGGTHGGLDDISSTGVLLSNFAPTADTSSSRVAVLYDGFKGGGALDRPEASRTGWVYRTRIGRQPTVEIERPASSTMAASLKVQSARENE
jgi:hypothetical protein